MLETSRFHICSNASVCRLAIGWFLCGVVFMWLFFGPRKSTKQSYCFALIRYDTQKRSEMGKWLSKALDVAEAAQHHQYKKHTTITRRNIFAIFFYF